MRKSELIIGRLFSVKLSIDSIKFSPKFKWYKLYKVQLILIFFILFLSKLNEDKDLNLLFLLNNPETSSIIFYPRSIVLIFNILDDKHQSVLKILLFLKNK